MGTTQRIGSGVKKDPNWGNISTSVTSAAKAIEEISKLEPISSTTDNPNLESQHKKLIHRRDSHINSSFERLVKLGGGSKKISSGGSNKIGRAGLKSSSKLASFFAGVSNFGLERTLNQIGFGSLVGKNIRDVTDFLLDYCCDSNIGMDEAAAKTALCEVLKILSIEADGDINKLEDLMKSYVDSNLLSNLLCDFFGTYIYEYLWERLEERLREIRGAEISKATFDSIRKEIKGRVLLLNSNRPIVKIDWAGNEGKLEIEKIFETILKIEGE